MEYREHAPRVFAFKRRDTQTFSKLFDHPNGFVRPEFDVRIDGPMFSLMAVSMITH
jgi:hypothetical protein